MVVFASTFPFRRISLWVAMETMHFKHSQIKFLWHARGPNEQFDSHGILSWGSKVGQIRSQGTCNMILFAVFQPFSSFIVFFLPPPQKKKNAISPKICLRTFFYETGHLPDTKIVDTIFQGISYGSRVFYG